MTYRTTGSTPPNVVILLLDTAMARNFSCYGHERETTPNIDQFAESGVKFSHAISVSPWTLPSHTSLFTGVPPSVHRTNSLDSYLSDEIKTLPTVLNEHGYTTVGMASNPWLSSQFGVTRGFDTFHHLHGIFGTDSYKEFVKTVTDTDLSVLNRITELFGSQSTTRLIKNSLTAAQRQFFEREDDGAQAAVRTSREVIGQDDPYFLFVNFLEPHLPYEPPEHLEREFMPDSISDQDIDEVNQDGRAYNVRNVEMSDSDFDILKRLYDAEIHYVDKRIQEILYEIASSDQDTIVIIMGDHGENIGDHGLMSHNYSIHDTLLHIPLIIRSPEIFEGGETVHERISSLDIPTTIMDVLSEFGISDDEFKRQQSGISLRNVPEESIDRHVVSEYLNPIPPIEKMESLCENPNFDVSVYDRTLRATYSGDFKLIRGSDGTEDLYDVSGGAEKLEEKGAAKRDMVKRLETQLSRWIDRHERQDQSELQSDHEEELKERLGELGYL